MESKRGARVGYDGDKRTKLRFKLQHVGEGSGIFFFLTHRQASSSSASSDVSGRSSGKLGEKCLTAAYGQGAARREVLTLTLTLTLTLRPGCSTA
jgi:hypothetical protein